MPREICKTTIKDVASKPHKYELVQHGGWSGRHLQGKLMQAAARLVGHGLGAADLGGRSLLDARINGGSLVSAVEPLIELILQDDDFLLDLFQHTTRDGQQLADTGVFELAYQGNWGELYHAVYWAVEVNFGAPLASYLSGLLGAQATQLKQRLSGFWLDLVSTGSSGDPGSSDTEATEKSAKTGL